MRRLDIIRASSARPNTPAATIGDIGDARVQTFSSFSPTGLFNSAIIPIRSPNSPMDRSKIAAENRKQRKFLRERKEMEHLAVAEEYLSLAAMPKTMFKAAPIVSTMVEGRSISQPPENLNPSRASTPGGIPPRPSSRHTEIRFQNHCLSTSTLPDARPFSRETDLSTNRRPPLSRPASALTVTSLSTVDTSISSRPQSASTFRATSAVRLNEVLRTSMSYRSSTTASPVEVRPMRSFVS